MSKIKIISLIFITIFIVSCNSDSHDFPIDKRYWTTTDYASVIYELKYGYESDEKLPTFDNAKNRIVVEKLTDQQNFEIILGDEELGLKYKSEVAETFFMRWKDMQNIYQALDRKDKYIYDKEMIAVWQFGLGVQLRYFKLGNDNILMNVDDPESSNTISTINSNVDVLIGNYLIYLDEINNEKALSENGKRVFAEGIDIYYTQLIELYPNADYRAMERKIELMKKKTESNVIKKSLIDLEELIESKKS